MKVNVRTVCQKSLTVHHLPVKASLTQETLLCVGGWGGGGFICPWYEFQMRSFHILRSRPCSGQYITHLYVICRPFIHF